VVSQTHFGKFCDFSICQLSHGSSKATKYESESYRFVLCENILNIL